MKFLQKRQVEAEVMPRADGKQHPSSPGSSVAARENQKPQNLPVAVAPNDSPLMGLAVAMPVATSVAPRQVAVADQRLSEQSASATAATNGQRQDHRPAHSVPFDGWSRELDGVLAEFCKRGRDGERKAILA